MQNTTHPESDLIVRQAALEEIVDLRWAVLRQGLPREEAVFAGDEDESTLHMAAFHGGQAVGCATLHLSRLDDLPAWQLRGMAVRPDFQRRGVGRRLLEGLDALLARDGLTLRLWCNAREPAVGFYRGMGWMVFSERFHIETAGPHFRMSRGIHGR
jgi:GNAT superfamily N-acetyltransferase